MHIGKSFRVLYGQNLYNTIRITENVMYNHIIMKTNLEYNKL